MGEQGYGRSMGWFGLFDLVRFRHGADPQEGWALPNSRLRITDPHLAALYRNEIANLGKSFQPDLFDLAAHHLARTAAPQKGEFHIDLRMTGRPARLLFGSDSEHSLLAWHATTAEATVRLSGAEAPVTMAGVALDALLGQTLPIEHIATLSAWVQDANALEQVMRRLDAFVSDRTRAIVRLPASALADTLARLRNWPVRCAAVIPCPSADEQAGGEDVPADVMLCFESVSLRPVERATTQARNALRVVRAPLWNDKGRAFRSIAQGGVRVLLPERGLVSGASVTLLGEAPATNVGSLVAGLRSAPRSLVPGFDTLLDISFASVFEAKGATFVTPLAGPVVADPQDFRETRDGTGFLREHDVLDGEAFAIARDGPIRRISDRVTFLLGRSKQVPEYVTEVYPSLELVFQLCDRERLALADIDVLIPGVTDPWTHESLAIAGFAPEQVLTDASGVLFRRLLLASPASQSTLPQRAPWYDLFWARMDRLQRDAGFVSFSQPRPTGRIMLVDPQRAPIVNSADLEAVARERGYVIACPRQMTLAAFGLLMQSASVIVGAGELLGFTCLAADCSVGMLLSNASATLPYPALHAAASKGHAVFATFGAAIGARAGSGFVVAADRFARLLDRIETAARLSPVEVAR